MSYILPSPTDSVSCSWQCHRDRNPPSTEPGTDYACGYGSTIVAVGNGTVVDRKTDNGSATGRFVTIDLDDGRRTRSLHMSSISVNVGQRVSQGQVIGKSGASGYGNDWYYGPHVHQTLWNGHAYSFCSTCTIDFALYVGPTQVAPNQRVVGPNGANGRSDPSTKNPATQFLDPGTVGNFDGWINGENVQGQPVWFRGSVSGDWFWAGGFTDQGTHDLADLNTANLGPQQRKATAGLNGRAEPNTGSAAIAWLDEGAVGDFDGWVYGGTVDGENRWLRGQHSGAWFSLKYLDPGNTDNLTDLNTPTTSSDRTAGANPVNVRSGPYTSSPVTGSIPGGTIVTMNGWATGENVQGTDAWYRRASDGGWAWAGGFTSQDTAGLEEVSAPAPPNQNNPMGLAEYPPVYPDAVIGLEAPLGFADCKNPVDRSSRAKKGNETVTPLIDRAIVHHTGTTVDQLTYFSTCNDRSSCPTNYVRPNGDIIETIRPGAKPASTSPEWNYRSIAFEVLDETGDPNWLIPEDARIAVARYIAWLAEFDGKELDGIPVSFTIDRTHVIGHNEALPGTTICPGPDMDVDGIVAMAQQFWDDAHPTEPCPPCPDCPEPGEGVLVPLSTLQAWEGQATDLADAIAPFTTQEVSRVKVRTR